MPQQDLSAIEDEPEIDLMDKTNNPYNGLANMLESKSFVPVLCSDIIFCSAPWS